METQLPTFHDLETLRTRWIEDALKNGTIDDASLVAEHFGKTVDIKYWQGEFKKYSKKGLSITCYRWTAGFATGLGRAYEKFFLSIEDEGKEFVNLSLWEPGMIPGKDDFVVPGKWQDKVSKLVKVLKQQEEESDAERDLARRTKLAKLLHII